MIPRALAPLSHWRDSRGLEVDLVVEDGPTAIPVEIKSGATYASGLASGLRTWKQLAGDPDAPAALVYEGDETFESGGISVLSWRAL